MLVRVRVRDSVLVGGFCLSRWFVKRPRWLAGQLRLTRDTKFSATAVISEGLNSISSQTVCSTIHSVYRPQPSKTCHARAFLVKQSTTRFVYWCVSIFSAWTERGLRLHMNLQTGWRQLLRYARGANRSARCCTSQSFACFRGEVSTVFFSFCCLRSQWLRGFFSCMLSSTGHVHEDSSETGCIKSRFCTLSKESLCGNYFHWHW